MHSPLPSALNLSIVVANQRGVRRGAFTFLFRVMRVAPLLLLVPLLAACSTSSQLHGTWETSLRDKPGSAVWLVFDDDAKYELDYRDKPGADLWGHYSVDGDEVTLIDDGRSEEREVNRTPGTYKYLIEENKVRFTVVKDKNTARSAGLQRGWLRRGAPAKSTASDDDKSGEVAEK